MNNHPMQIPDHWTDPEYWLEKLLTIPTPTGTEHRLIPLLAQTLQQLGFHIQIHRVFRQQAWNLYAYRGKNHNNIDRPAFLTHLDTVTLPCPTQRQNHKWIGRGTVDTKGQIAALISAIARVPHNLTMEVYFVADEEEGGTGSEALPISPGKLYFVLEPTDLQPMTQTTGALEYIVHIPMKGSHAGNPQAHHLAQPHHWCQPLTTLNELAQLPGIQTIHILQMQTPTWNLYALPETLNVRIELRLTDQASLTQVRQAIETWLRQKHYTWQYVEGFPSFSIALTREEYHWLHTAWQKTGIPFQTGTYTAWTDAVNLWRRAARPLILGCGSLARAHTSHEWISTQELHQGTLLLQNLILTWHQKPKP